MRGNTLQLEAARKRMPDIIPWNERKLLKLLNIYEEEDVAASRPETVNKADGLSTTGEPTQILKGKVETPLYTVYRSSFPPDLRQP